MSLSLPATATFRRLSSLLEQSCMNSSGDPAMHKLEDVLTVRR